MAETPVKNDNTEATDDMMVGDMIIGAVIFMGNLSIFLGYLFRIAQMVYNHIRETYFWILEV